MKIKHLLEEIENCRKEYGEDFLEWDIYTEQLSPEDRKNKSIKDLNVFGGNWDIIDDGDGWEYFKCVGFFTIFPNKKIFTINVNY